MQTAAVGKWVAGFSLAVLVWAPMPVRATPTMIYEGTFKCASPEPSFTAFTICFVPDGNTRLGDPVAGPTVVIGWEARTTGIYSTNIKVREVGIPTTLAKTPAQLTTTIGAYVGTAISRLPYATAFGPFDVDTAGNFWGPASGNNSTWGGNGLLSNPGIWMLGTVGDVPALTVPEGSANWAGMGWCINGSLRRGNGSGGALPENGTNNGATFITADDDGYIRQDVRIGNGGSTFTKSVLFGANINNPGASPDLHPGVRDLKWRVDYVRDTGGDEWFAVHWPAQLTGTNKSSLVHFFPGNTTGGGLVAPTCTLDMEPSILTGAGYTAGSVASGAYSLRDMAVDWRNSKLYVLDSLGYGSTYVHVFTVEGATQQSGTVILFK